MMKRLLSIFTASALAVSAAAALQLSAAAFTLNSTYDEVKINNSFNTESNTGSADNTAYKISDGNYQLWKGLNFTSNYYASVDFMYTDATQKMEFRNKTSGGNYGAAFTVDGTNFKNTGGVNTILFNSFSTNKWYRLELEGRMKVTGAVTYITIYDYTSGTTVCNSQTLSLRNFASGSSNTPGWMLMGSGVCFDNEYAVAEWPDAVVISQEENTTELSAGESLIFTAEAKRAGSSNNLTQPKINWSVSGVKSGEEEYFNIDDGKLTVNAQASGQTVNVVATAASNGDPAGIYAVSINPVDISSEKFDTIVLSGNQAVAAGSTAQYSFTASKGGNDVTSTLSADDVAWSVVDSTGSRSLGNRFITISGGLLTVDSSVIGQDICVRASTADGLVYADYPVTISTASAETIINYNACEDKVANDYASVVQGSWDGSSYYKKNTSGDFFGNGTLGTNTTNGDVLIAVDVKFEADGAGFTTIRRDGGQGLWIRRHNGKLSTQTGNSSYSDMNYTIDADSWYHIELMFDLNNNKLNIWKYDSDGNRTNKATFTKDSGLYSRSSSNGFNRITLEGSIGIDNYLVIYPHADKLNVIPDEDTVQAGQSLNVAVTSSRDGLAMDYLSNSSVNWAIYDSNNQYPIATDDVTVTAGVVTASAMAAPQTVYVRATSVYDNTVFGFAPIRITAGKQFEITNIGVDSVNENEVVMIYANKLTDYKDDVVFLMTFFDENGRLVGAYSKKANAKNLSVGENEIVIDYTLPEGYNKETGTAKLMAWTSLTSNEEPEGISGSFRASYSDGVITLSNAPSVSGTTTIAIFDSGNNVVYQAQSDSAVASLNTGTLASGGYTVTLGGAVVDGSYVTYKTTFTVD